MITDYYFFITKNCPNRCNYCYVDYQGNEDMTIEDIDRYIDQYHPQRIIFFGGEPLLRLDLMEYTIKKYYGKIKFQVVTSTMVNFKEFIKFNKRYPIDEIQFSWDGFVPSRVDCNGKDISERVYENILYAAINQGMHFDVKAVLDNTSINKFLETNYIFNQLYKYGVNGEFVIAHGEDFDDNFFKKFKKYLPYMIDVNLTKPYSDAINKIAAFISKDEYCSCDIGKYRTIDKYGRVNNCTALAQIGVDLDNNKCQQRCRARECLDCKYACICDGGCRYERWNMFKMDWVGCFNPNTCKVMEIYYDTIERYLDRITPETEDKLIHLILKQKEWALKRFGLE